jgi:hypothetical protein
MQGALASLHRLQCCIQSPTLSLTLQSCATILSTAGKGASSEVLGCTSRHVVCWHPSQARGFITTAPRSAAQPALQEADRETVIDGELRQSGAGGALEHVSRDNRAQAGPARQEDAEGWQQGSTGRTDTSSRDVEQDRGRGEVLGHLPKDERGWIPPSPRNNFPREGELIGGQRDVSTSVTGGWAYQRQSPRRTLALELGLQEAPMTGSEKLRVWRQSMEMKLQEKLWGRRQVTGTHYSMHRKMQM